MITEQPSAIQIKPLETRAETEACARMMAATEPWITLGRDYPASVATLTDPVKEVYLAVQGKAVAGFIIINMTGAFIGYIQTVCVSPEGRGMGIGTQLIRYGEDRILRETPNVFICVSSFNPNARRLYQRLGFEVIGELKDFIVCGHSEILLRKTVGPLNQVD